MYAGGFKMRFVLTTWGNVATTLQKIGHLRWDGGQERDLGVDYQTISPGAVVIRSVRGRQIRDPGTIES
ncbi:hypothetical protein CEXT_218141 [Caerostris extrusa]|uniref:Uncharacterized protein n=1 Tax=Caerostris extrusa TaxID=172846 RepID=A0AAV4Y5K7_CAEEX|nr:hypothetical protein CEXT_218141 [Caerostris extrusa]